MGSSNWLVAFLLVYVLADFVSGIVLKRCVLPGLKCGACRVQERHE